MQVINGVDNAYNESNNQVSQVIYNDIQEQLNKVKQEAIEFANFMTNTQGLYVQLIESIKHRKDLQQTIEANGVITELFKGKNLNQNLKTYGPEIYQRVLHFQQTLNETINRQQQIVYVWHGVDGKTPTLLLLQDEQVLEKLKMSYSSSNNLSARFNITKTADVNQYEKIEDKMDIPQDSQNVDLLKLNQAYLESLSRWTKSKTKRIMWKTDNWHVYKIAVSAKGDISEAYAAALLTKPINPPINYEDIEWNIQSFAQLIAQVDNISGMLQGDISTDTFNYAIKSFSASLLGITQFISFAIEIANTEYLTLDTIKAKQKELADKGNVRNQIEVYSIDAAGDAFLQEIRKWDINNMTMVSTRV